MSHYDRDPVTGELELTAGMRSLDEMKAVMLDICYPVGTVYISTANVSPAIFLGGTWTALSGYMLRAASSGVVQGQNASDGGSDDAIVVSHDHTFTGSAVNSGTISANHYHGYHCAYKLSVGAGYNGEGITGGPNSSGSAVNFNAIPPQNTGTVSANHVHSVTAAGTVGSKGSSGTNKNLPKYKNVYMWERTA